MSKRVRTLDSFFSPPPLKRPKAAQNVTGEEQRDEHGDTKGVSAAYSRHATYPFSITHLPMELREILNFVPAAEARAINDQPDLDLLSFTPFIPKAAQVELFEFLRAELPFYVSFLLQSSKNGSCPKLTLVDLEESEIHHQTRAGRDCNQHTEVRVERQ